MKDKSQEERIEDIADNDFDNISTKISWLLI